jgi:WD40 repeat protein
LGLPLLDSPADRFGLLPGLEQDEGLRPFPSRFGGYEILEEISRGGMGIVFKARKPPLNRLVALKLPIAGPFASGEFVQRFSNEAQALARLNHPNIVSIYEAGAADGQPFLAMEFIDGQALSDLFRDQLPSARTAATLARQIAGAIEFAHQQGILHRDLKPSNIMSDSAGRLRVTDFGLAADLLVQEGATRSGQIVGTPGYMAPEQAAGNRSAHGPRTDIYSIGAILYFLLTGRPPFQANSLEQTLLQITQSEPAAPCVLNPATPRDIQTICLKCLSKEPNRRYASARALCDDLDCFIAGRPIQARPVGRLEYSWRWSRRNPGFALTIAAAAVACLTGFAATVWQWQRADRHARQLADELVRSEIERVDELMMRDEPDVAMAHLARMLRSHPQNRAAVARALSAIRYRTFPVPATAPMRHETPILDAHFSPDGQFVITGTAGHRAGLWHTRSGLFAGAFPAHHTDSIVRVVFSPDGSRIATASTDGSARLWDPLTGQPLGSPMRHRGPINWVAFSPDGTQLATASDDHTAVIWDATDGRGLVSPLVHQGEVNLICFSPDGSMVITVSDDSTARLWDAHSSEPVTPPLRHDQRVIYAVFSPDGRHVVTCSWDGTARTWDASHGESVGEPCRHDSWVYAAAFSPDGKVLATAANDATARLWEAGTGRPLSAPLAHDSSVLLVAFSPDGRLLATASQSGHVKLWRVSDGRLAACPLRQMQAITALEFSPDNRFLLTASQDGTALVWPIQPPTTEAVAVSHPAGVIDALWSPDEQAIVTICRDSQARVWKLSRHDGSRATPPAGATLIPNRMPPTGATDVVLAALLPHEHSIRSVTLSPHGLVATASRDRSAKVWDLETGHLVGAPLRHERIVWSAEFSPNGRWIATASWDNTAKIWSAKASEMDAPAAVLPHERGVSFARFGRSGKRLVTSCFDHTARIWLVPSGDLIRTLRGHKDAVIDAAFSPDERWVATASNDHTARIWDAQSGQAVSPPLLHGGEVYHAWFSPSGKMLLTVSRDKTVRIWETPTARPVIPPIRHDAPLGYCEFSPDETRVVTATESGVARIWELRWGLPVSEPIRHSGGILSAHFSADGDRLLTGSEDGTARIWWTPWPSTPAPEWFPDFLTALGGVSLDSSGQVERIDPQVLCEFRRPILNVSRSDPYRAAALQLFVPISY